MIISVIAIASAASACWGYWLKYRSRLHSEHRYERIISEKMNLLRDAVNMGYSEEQLSQLDIILDRIASQQELKILIEPETEETPKVEEKRDELDSMDIEQAINVIKRKLEQQ